MLIFNFNGSHGNKIKIELNIMSCEKIITIFLLEKSQMCTDKLKHEDKSVKKKKDVKTRT